MFNKILLSVLFLAFKFTAFSQTALFTTNSLNNTFCQGDTIIFNNLSDSYNYLIWDFNDGYQTYTISPLHAYNTSGTYNVELIVYNESGLSDTAHLEITINPTPDLFLTPSQDTTIAEGSYVDITASGNYDNILWSTGEMSDDILVTTQNNYVCYVFFDATGCESSDSVYVTVNRGVAPYGLAALILNNVITPNGDGINDFFFISEIEKFSANVILEIYNNEGNIIYTNLDYKNTWGGKDNNGNYLNTGTYYYILKIEGEKGTTGFIDLLR